MDINTLVLIGLSLVVAFFVFYLIPKLKEKNVPVGQYLEQSKQFLTIIDGLTKAGLGNQNKALVESIVNYAKLAVNYSEQLYNNKEIQAEERKDKALEFIVNAMKEAGTELTSEQLEIANAVIESVVFNLPKTKATRSKKQV